MVNSVDSKYPVKYKVELMSIQIVTINNVLPFEDVQRCQRVDMTVTLECAVAVLDRYVTEETGTAAKTLIWLVSIVFFFLHVCTGRARLIWILFIDKDFLRIKWKYELNNLL